MFRSDWPPNTSTVGSKKELKGSRESLMALFEFGKGKDGKATGFSL